MSRKTRSGAVYTAEAQPEITRITSGRDDDGARDRFGNALNLRVQRQRPAMSGVFEDVPIAPDIKVRVTYRRQRSSQRGSSYRPLAPEDILRSRMSKTRNSRPAWV